MNLVRVLMVDDHLMLAEALSARLSEVPELWVVGHCATSDPRLAEVAQRSRPDVIALDVEPAGTATGSLVRQLRETLPTAAIVVLTGTGDARQAVEAARAGAAAWVRKESSVEQLTEVLRGVSRGHSWYPPELLGPVLRELREDAARAGQRGGPLDVLSDRERDVLCGMVAGKRGAQIAEELLISTETVRTHTRSILAKLRVHSQLEAVSVACAAGLRVDADAEPDIRL
ncbi:LuxR C-terminal-related transcriptional regulator [Saccharopolyspora sp. 5N708]|uniref:LuxR C-terminal-related transcriptional regulator n=1 Tax=Saccharopolyspora sp. 5N708 TaxID=3457424 RepID=UPI003FD4B24F